MKYILLFLLLSCKAPETSEQKAQKAITEFLLNNMNDKNSYEPLDFGTLKPLKGGYEMSHKFRQNNKMGAKELRIVFFDMDSSFAVYQAYY